MSSSAAYAPPRRHLGAYIVIITALIALCITAWRFFTPLSGITDSGGAMVAMLAEFVLFILGLLLIKTEAGGARAFFLFLAWVGVIGTFFAALLLHGWWTAAVLVVCAVGVLIETFGSKPTRSA
ncbi:MAG TPA: hypothetical protein DIT33_14490 [Pseudomonas sp.]|jgi:hydrogenase-4 membrane subunit HyfE|uniref:Uncharacterized protein n=1 Tax=Pseudomonas helleri TaxID=1608996 RepID=A0A0J6L1X8_9PSED|nr:MULTISPECIES: hypothetical protein [Pseudomonas]KMN08286.1 hypothetical protein TU84_16695 [Pseudomonas helleri]KMN25060.1 hypothetical protein TU85_00505 [Pseudomonas helleri]MQT30363.1 hypothetical protein [Pseudomonas helleri]MQT38511.1 hypothetical protein [Pseudomonas helleri]MQT46102.1 hypothetical protein [Pseudomonas helleri]